MRVLYEPRPGERAYVCGTPGCRRFTYVRSEAGHDWLIAYRRVGRETDRSKVVVRCPQHVSQYAMRLVGMKVNPRSLAAVRRNKARDTEQLLSGETFLLDPFTTSSGDLGVVRPYHGSDKNRKRG